MNTEKMNEETSRRYLDSIALYMRIPRKYKESLTYSDGINRTMKLLEILGSKELAEKYILEDHAIVKNLFTGPNPDAGIKIQNAGISGVHRARHIGSMNSNPEEAGNLVYELKPEFDGVMSSKAVRASVIDDADIFKDGVPQWIYSTKHHPSNMDKFRQPNSIRDHGESEIDLTRRLSSEQDNVLKGLLEEALEERRRWKLEATPEQIVGRIRTRHQSPYLYGIPSVGDSTRNSMYIHCPDSLYGVINQFVLAVIHSPDLKIDRKDFIQFFIRLGCRKPKVIGNKVFKRWIHVEPYKLNALIISALREDDTRRFGCVINTVVSKRNRRRLIKPHKLWLQSELAEATYIYPWW